MLDLIKNLCSLDGTSGREADVRNYIISQIKDYATDITVDPLGNLIVFKKGAKKANKKVLLDAHMDEVGFVITSINSDGSLNFECVGGISTSVMLGRPVTVGENKIDGVIGVVPVHLLPADKKAELPDVKSLVIHPATTTHSQLTDDELTDQGIKPNTIRLSIGTEHIDDILADLQHGFDAVQGLCAI